MKSLSGVKLVRKIASEKNQRLRALKLVHVGAFPDTENGREAMAIHAEMLRDALKEQHEIQNIH